MHRVVAVVLATAALPVSATVGTPIPEPGVFELLVAGAVAGLIVWARNRRK